MRIFLAAISLFLLTGVTAQEKKQDIFEPGQRPHSFYAEAGGPGLYYSLNYDTRFKQTRNGWGIRAGVGYTAVDDHRLFALPVQLSYFLGKNGNYFEMGAGATFLNTRDRHIYYDYDEMGEWAMPAERIEIESDSQVMGTLTMGYRRQPVDGGFLFRVGFSPILRGNEFIPYLPYISFGYSF